MKTKALDREGREMTIITAFAMHIQKGHANQLTAYKIARKIGLAPSGHLNNILRQMVADGKLDTFSRPNKGKWTTWFYALPEGSYEPPRKHRTINLNARGKSAGQLEL